jgi:uncharacterized protein
VTVFDLRSIKVRSGEEYRDEVEIDLGPFVFAGQRYVPVPEHVPAELVVTRAATGTLFQLRFRVRLHGPCFRCLEDAVVERTIGSREYQATNPEGSDELTTPYLTDSRLDLTAWARDALVLELPDKILCRDDCAGLCPVCGRDLNREPHEHEREAVDPRWAELAKLRDRL